jgi:NAD(P)-dependent dehydrogenase (short-subunit alcohol dehydrogenase family)
MSEPQDFADRPGCALVTGGTGGIGSAVARLLARRGADVAITYRADADGARSLVQELRAGGRRAGAWAVDLSDEAAAASVVGEAVAEFGALHTLVLASGPHVPMIHLSKVTPADYRRQVEGEAIACFNVIHPALAHLRASAGSIVAVTTAATDRFPVRDGLSAGPKGSIETLARALAAEEGRFGVRVNCVGPGMLTDGMAARLMAAGELDERALAVTRSNIPLRRFGSAHGVAEAVAFLASDRADFVSGQKLNVDGGYSV